MATLEELEGEVWPEPESPTHLIATCHQLRKKNVKDFSNEDMRIMIGQGISLRWLAPKALDLVALDPFAQGDLYPSDIILALLRPKNWGELEPLSERLEATCRTLLRRLDRPSGQDASLDSIRSSDPDLENDIRVKLEAYLNHRSHNS